jgi:hypothetical protein
MLLAVAALLQPGARAQIHVLPDRETQRVFCGEGRKVLVTFHNAGDTLFDAELRTRLYQASSTKVVPLGDAPWKQLQVPAGETVIDAAALRFPPVKAETRFLVQWTEGATRLLGMTEVFVYPTNLLKDLKPLAGSEPLGVFDPQNQLKPLLKAVDVECFDLERLEWADFQGKLAIVGPFHSKAQMRGDLPSQVRTLAAKGAAVVWIEQPPEKHLELAPSYFSVQEGRGVVVVAQAGVVANLPESPQAQLSLLHLARLALHPEPPKLPSSVYGP